MSQEEEKKLNQSSKANCDSKSQARTSTSTKGSAKLLKLTSAYTSALCSSNLATKIDSTKQESIVLLKSKRRNQTLNGPIQVIDGAVIESSDPCELDHPPQGPQRRYDCCNYDSCLKIAAALNWDSFTCRDCDGKVSENLLWRAQHAVHKDKTAKVICDLPDPRCRKIENGSQTVGLKLVADKANGN